MPETERRKAHPLGDKRTLATVGAGSLVTVAGLLTWLDGRYASAADVPSKEAVIRIQERVSNLDETLKELKADVKELLRRTPR